MNTLDPKRIVVRNVVCKLTKQPRTHCDYLVAQASDELVHQICTAEPAEAAELAKALLPSDLVWQEEVSAALPEPAEPIAGNPLSW